MDSEVVIDDITQGVPTYAELKTALVNLVEEDCGGMGMSPRADYLLATSQAEIAAIRLLVRLGDVEVTTQDATKVRAVWTQRGQP